MNKIISANKIYPAYIFARKLKFRITSIFTLAISLFAFLIINTPSVKIIYSSELINIIGVIGVYGLGIYDTLLVNKSSMTRGCYTKSFFFLWTILWIVLLYYGVIGSEVTLSNRLILRYIGVYLTVIGVLGFVSIKHLYPILFLQISWGTGLAAVEVIQGVPLSNNLGQHYITLGVPIGASLVAAFGLIIFSSSKLFLCKSIKLMLLFKLILYTCIILDLIAICSLFGRSPVLASGLTILMFLLFKIGFIKAKLAAKLHHFIWYLFVLMSLSIVATRVLSDYWLNRLLRFFNNYEEEPRMLLIKPAMEFISENWLGYGLNSSDFLVGYHPHNIFIEVMLSAGIIGLFLMLLLVVLYAICMIISIKLNPSITSMSMVASFLFLVWMTSYSLAHSYILFSAIAMVIKTVDEAFVTQQSID